VKASQDEKKGLFQRAAERKGMQREGKGREERCKHELDKSPPHEGLGIGREGRKESPVGKGGFRSGTSECRGERYR